MEALQLVVHGAQLIADVIAVLDALKGQQHRFDLTLAVDQHTALG
jgi:hypothetical protein